MSNLCYFLQGDEVIGKVNQKRIEKIPLVR